MTETRPDCVLKAEINLYYDLRVADEPNAPLLIALHGYGASKRQMLREAQLMAPDGFAIVALQGFHQHMRDPKEPGGPLRFGFGWVTNFRPEESIDIHHKAVLELIESVASNKVADPTKVFLLGFSQSCALNYRFAFTYPAKLRGIVGMCGGVPGDWETSDRYQKTAADVSKIVEEAYKIFGEFGYTDYTFIVNLRGGGGLEHLNSTALQYDRFGFKPESRYKGFLGLVAHEYFHNFNVKRIRPDALGPFDYEKENYTKLLWVAEGGTEYYSNILLRRAGLITAQEYLEARANGIEQLMTQPGRLETSVEEASFDAWIKYYRQDENSVNNQISYYDKGELVNMMLDITIRGMSDGRKSLDDVMRYLYNEYFKKGRNYTPEDFQKAAELMAGRSLDDFFAKYVRGETDFDVNSIISYIGLQLNAVESNRGKAFIGADLIETGDRLTVRSVRADTPAYQQGINSGDQIIAIDGNRVTRDRLQQYIDWHKPGDRVRLTIFRNDRLRDIDFVLGDNTRREYSFSPVANPTEQQRRLYRDYMKSDL